MHSLTHAIFVILNKKEKNAFDQETTIGLQNLLKIIEILARASRAPYYFLFSITDLGLCAMENFQVILENMRSK